ncbi:hypothetical protein Fmac_029619 [Flemingia macrophylla]|uniref:Uncharacterized protein n=1 Tax=Flemingia macrophylla TaxID=520843 RepID=A0ABD1LAW4_9FABA
MELPPACDDPSGSHLGCLSATVSCSLLLRFSHVTCEGSTCNEQPLLHLSFFSLCRTSFREVHTELSWRVRLGGSREKIPPRGQGHFGLSSLADVAFPDFSLLSPVLSEDTSVRASRISSLFFPRTSFETTQPTPPFLFAPTVFPRKQTEANGLFGFEDGKWGVEKEGFEGKVSENPPPSTSFLHLPPPSSTTPPRTSPSTPLPARPHASTSPRRRQRQQAPPPHLHPRRRLLRLHPLQPGLPQPPQRSLRLGQRRRGVGLLDGLELGGDELPGDATPVRSVTGSPTDVAASQRPTLPTKPPSPFLPPRLRRLLGKHAAAPVFGAAEVITLFPSPHRISSLASPRRPPPQSSPSPFSVRRPLLHPWRRRPPTPESGEVLLCHGALHVVLPSYLRLEHNPHTVLCTRLPNLVCFVLWIFYVYCRSVECIQHQLLCPVNGPVS